MCECHISKYFLAIVINFIALPLKLEEHALGLTLHQSMKMILASGFQELANDLQFDDRSKISKQG